VSEITKLVVDGDALVRITQLLTGSVDTSRMSTYHGFDRRSEQQTNDGDDTALLVCRVCWSHIPLPDADEVEIGDDGRPFIHCPQCGGSFLVRDDDAGVDTDGTGEADHRV
jgi:hypothetical protein